LPLEEEPSPEKVDMDDSDDDSIASTIHTDHDSEEEWQVSDIIAAWEVDGSLRYLVKWEGFDLYEATWEPEEHLNDELINGWEKAKAEGDFDLFQRIRDWKNAWKEKYLEKLARHQERNRRRKKQGLNTTPFTYMDDCLAWVNRFPDGDELSGSAVSSPSGTVPDLDTDTGIGQQSQSLPAKRKLSTASLSEDNSPKPSGQNNTTNTHKKTPPKASLNTTFINHKQASQRQSSSVSEPKSAPTNSLLFSKFSKSTKRTDQRKSQLTARKTQPAQAFTGNVFVGGKERKKRATLAECATDPSKTPKLMRHRYARIIEKAGRDRECAAPIRMPSDLISLNPADRPTSNSNTLSSEVMNNGGHPSSDGDKRAPQDESPEDRPPSKAKLKKSISWGTVEETIISAPEESMVFDREASLFFRENSVADTDTASTVKAEEPLDGEPTLSLAQPSSRRVTWSETTPAPTMQRDKSPLSGTIAANIQFGPGTRETISVDFERHRLQPQNEVPWPTLFENEPILIFTHTCITRDFEDQEKILVTDKLGTGSIASDSNSTGLDLVADWLRCRSLGVLLYRPDLCIFIHMLPKQDKPQYSLFCPASHFTTRSLAPIALPEGLDRRDVLPRITSTLFNRMLGFQYEKLLPETNPMSSSKHTFFLAFPTSAGLEARFLGTWLRSCNPECKILSSFSPGHWRSFLRLDHGVVIVHEEAIWSIRLFPNVKLPLQRSSNFSFWIFSKSLQPLPLYDSLEQSCRIGDVTLQPICGHRKVLLVTPSFVVSQPQQAWNFFKWFYKDWHRARDSARLVVCADFDTWILGVATEYEDDRARHKSKSFVRKIESGIAKKEHETLYKIWSMVRGLMDSSSEEQPAFIYAPDSIDGNDEQSLVNWFGWWSIMNLDMYRKFSVVGSNNKAPERLTRHITRPEFSTSTLISPDEVYRVVDPIDSSQTPLQEISTADSVRNQPRRKFRLIIGDDATSFRKILNELESSTHRVTRTPVTLFNAPVAYWNPGMVDAFSREFAPYSQCVWYFGETVHGPGHHNTGLAFCYTPERTWSPGETRENLERSRRPWIVAYRAIEPFKKPWTGTELVIWDPAWKANARGTGEIYEGDLIEAQRRMIQAVREKLDTELELKKIWIRGPDLSPDGLTEPLDVTIHQLQRIMRDVRSSIPAPTWAMVNSGWRLVEPGDAPHRPQLPSPEPMDIDDPMDTSDVTDDALKTVFHPPRGKKMNRPSNCKNRLFQHCSHDKARGNNGKDTEYRFRPTMEWYEQQVEEGRGFEHIRVTAWEAVFERYRIDDPEQFCNDGD
jgi:chromo domain-containing protein 1